MSRFIRAFALLSILLDNLFIPVNLGFDFRGNYIIYFLYILYFIATKKKVRITPTGLLAIAGIVFVLTLVPILRGEGMLLFVKQLALILFVTLFAFLLINDYKFNVQELFRDYIKITYWAAIIAIIQLTSMIVGFRFGADYSYLGFDMGNFAMSIWRSQAWFREPSFFAVALMPTVFISLARLFNLSNMISRQRALIILFALLTSQSSVGLLGLLCAIALIILSRYSLVRAPVFLVLTTALAIAAAIGFYQIPDVKLRVDDSAKLFFSERVESKDIERTNISTYALFSNFRVALASFADRPLFGSGLGTYEMNYNKYIDQVLPHSQLGTQYPLNRTDAASMFLRGLSETGLFGIGLIAWFLISNRIKLNIKRQTPEQLNYWAINNAILVLFFTRLLRQGHYTVTGFMLFVVVYYYAKKYYPQGE